MSPPRPNGHTAGPAHPPPPRQAGYAERRQAGSASAELVIATPLLLLLLLTVVQFALWEHATHIAQAAAAQGLAAARVQGGGPAAGQAEVNLLLDQLGRGVLTDRVISSRVDAGQAVITIRGHAEAVLPFLHLPVTAAAAGPVELFYPAGTT